MLTTYDRVPERVSGLRANQRDSCDETLLSRIRQDERSQEFPEKSVHRNPPFPPFRLRRTALDRFPTVILESAIALLRSGT